MPQPVDPLYWGCSTAYPRVARNCGHPEGSQSKSSRAHGPPWGRTTVGIRPWRAFQQPFATKGTMSDTAKEIETTGVTYSIIQRGNLQDPNRYLIARFNVALLATEMLALNVKTMSVDRVMRFAGDESFVLDDPRDGSVMIKERIVTTGDGFRLVREVRNRSTGAWEEHPELGYLVKDRRTIDPLGFFDADPNKLYVATNRTSEFTEIRLYDIASRRWDGEPVFASAQADLVAAIGSNDLEAKAPAGVVGYVVAGPSVEQVFVDNYWAPIQRALQKQFAGNTVLLLNRNRSAQLAIVMVSGPKQAPIYYLIKNGRELKLLGRSKPTINAGALGNTQFGADFGFFNGWSYDLYAQWSRSNATYGTDFIYNDRVNAALSPVGPNFCDATLITISNPAPGCPTINWNTAAILEGQFSAAQSAFLFGHESGTTIYDQKLINGVITGDAFQLPAGAVGVAVGFEAREDEINDTPGAMARANNYWGLTTADRTVGSDKVLEVFGEASIPLLANTLLAESLTLDMSGRWTKYDSYGSGTVYKLGLNWEITPEYRIRATSGTSFRAPALFEMFLGNQTGFLGQRQIDPCINWDDSGDPRIVSACGPTGLNLPVNYAGGTSSALIISGGGGVGNLKAETSEAKTVGFIWSPDWINFRAAVDYWNIEVSDQVERFSARNIVFLCLTRSPPLTNGFCSLVTRDPTPGPNFGSIISVNSQYRNLPTELADGIDLRTRFSHEFSFGTMRLDTATTWTLNHEVDEIGDGANEINGKVYNADVVGSFDLYFDVEDWTLSWHTDFAGRASDAEDQDVLGNVFLYNGTPFDGRYKNHTEFMATHDASVRYRAADWEIIAGVQNIFDEPPPSISTDGNIRAGNSVVFGGPYDIIGRRGFISVTKEF